VGNIWVANIKTDVYGARNIANYKYYIKDLSLAAPNINSPLITILVNSFRAPIELGFVFIQILYSESILYYQH
jgi:hypothetical protein